jgi:hypothetical protein
MPWIPELFSAPVLERLQEKWQLERLEAAPYYDGLMSGEHDALVKSFAGDPVLHDPLQGRAKGVRAFEAFITERSAWLAQRNMLPRIGRHAHRPPMLHGDPELREPDVVAEYQRTLAAGDVDAILATFEPDAYAREPAGGQYTHIGRDGLRAFYELLFSNDGGIPLEHCALVDDGRACALEYNVVRWGKTDLLPEAGVAVYVRGGSGKLTAARIYDDVDPPLA